MSGKVALFGLLGGLLILVGAGVIVSRRVGKTAKKAARKPAPKPAVKPVSPAERDKLREAEVRRQLQGEISRADRLIDEGRDLARKYPPVPAEEY